MMSEYYFYLKSLFFQPHFPEDIAIIFFGPLSQKKLIVVAILYK